MPAEVLYPRAFVSLSATIGSENVYTGIVPHHVNLARRQHKQAVSGVFMTVYLAAPGTVDGDVRTDANRRFVGYVDEMEQTQDEHGPVVKLKARDLSALFRDFKPVPTAAAPTYGDTLSAAIQRIITVVPNTTDAAGNSVVTLALTLDAFAFDARVLGASAPRRAQTARVQLPNANDPHAGNAWAVIEHCAGLVSQLVTMDLDEIVIMDPPQTFAGTSPTVAKFVFGDETANLLKIERTRKFVRNRRGILATSYDPVHRVVLRSVFPPDNQLPTLHRPSGTIGGSPNVPTNRTATLGGTRFHRPRVRSATSRATNRARQHHGPPVPDREPVAAPAGIASQEMLDLYAQRVYLERDRQEIEGKMVCPVWTDDLLALRNADRFELQVNPALESELFGTAENDAAAVDLLSRRLLIDPDTLRVLIRATRAQESNQFYLRSITFDYQHDGQSSANIEFINNIVI